MCWRIFGAYQLARTSFNYHIEPGAAPVTSIKTITYNSPCAFGRQGPEVQILSPRPTETEPVDSIPAYRPAAAVIDIC